MFEALALWRRTMKLPRVTTPVLTGLAEGFHVKCCEEKFPKRLFRLG